MVTYGKYVGALTIILKQNIEGYFLLDVYNQGGNRVRFVTDIKNENLPKGFLERGTVEDWIDALLDRVCEGFYKKYYFLPFSKKLESNILQSMVNLTKDKYKGEEDCWYKY